MFPSQRWYKKSRGSSSQYIRVSNSKKKTDKNKIIAANTKLGLKLFSAILQDTPNENIFISPSSVAIALAMTYNGATGTTKQAMARALELEGLALAEINAGNAELNPHSAG